MPGTCAGPLKSVPFGREAGYVEGGDAARFVQREPGNHIGGGGSMHVRVGVAVGVAVGFFPGLFTATRGIKLRNILARTGGPSTIGAFCAALTAPSECRWAKRDRQTIAPMNTARPNRGRS